MTEREKMAQIVAAHLCPQGKTHMRLYGDDRRCYSCNNFAECAKVSNCVDALIEAGIGDIGEWKEKSNHWLELYSDCCEVLANKDFRVRVEKRALTDVLADEAVRVGAGDIQARYNELLQRAAQELIEDNYEQDKTTLRKERKNERESAEDKERRIMG